jgi:hypothetical protein
VANKSQIRITLDRVNYPGGFVSNNRGKALRITSASTGSPSNVRVSGTAADVLFGVTGLPVYRDGGGGLQGYAYGYWDISGILTAADSGTANTAVDNTIGKRLGDCSTVNKTLTVTVDGGTPINIVFSTNLTAVSNATILGTINTALGSAATASEYLVSKARRTRRSPTRKWNWPMMTVRASHVSRRSSTGLTNDTSNCSGPLMLLGCSSVSRSNRSHRGNPGASSPKENCGTTSSPASPGVSLRVSDLTVHHHCWPIRNRIGQTDRHRAHHRLGLL